MSRMAKAYLSVILTLIAILILLLTTQGFLPANASLEKNTRNEVVMLTPTLTKLNKLLPPPAKPINAPTPQQWADAEKNLGVIFPDDYKMFLSQYGEGFINDCVYLLSPLPDSPRPYNFKLKFEFYQMAFARDELADQLWPAPDGMLPCGGANDGRLLAWSTKGPPNSWTVRATAIKWYDNYRDYGCGIVEFIYGIVSGEDRRADFLPVGMFVPPYTYDTYNNTRARARYEQYQQMEMAEEMNR